MAACDKELCCNAKFPLHRQQLLIIIIVFREHCITLLPFHSYAYFITMY